MAMDTLPAATLKVIPTEFFFRLTKAGFDLPTPESNAKQFADGPSVTPRNSITEEVLRFAAENMFGNNQRALVANQSAMVCLAPARVPADFPDFRSLVIVFDTVSLRPLLGKAVRVDRQVADLAWLGVTTRQSWILVLTSSFAAFGWFFENFRFTDPSMEIRWHFTNERLTPRIETVEEMTIATIVLVERPGFDFDPIGSGAFNQIQRDCGLRFEVDVLGDMSFFRRAASPTHSSGRYSCASRRQ